MEKWFFSFGIGQPLKDYVVVIVGNYSDARDKMDEAFGKKWCAQYCEREWEEYENKYGKLKRIEL